MIAIRLVRAFVVTDCADLDDHTDRVMEALLALESSNRHLFDSDVSAALTTGVVEIGVSGAGADWDEAVSMADSAIRSVIHECGGDTSEWVPIKESSLTELVDA
jgi:hypothetical protein